MKVLVTGAAGFLGSAVIRALLEHGHSPTAGIHHTPYPGPDAHEPGPDRPGSVRTTPCDVTNPDSIRRAAVGHDAVVNTAYVQSGPLARATNVDGAANAATVCNNLGIHLLHISSDAVFSGNEDSYPESAPCDPIAGYQYGEQKAEAERRVHDLCPRATILRTSLLYSSDGSGALNRAVRESLSPASTAVYFTDEFRCPAHVDDVAAAAVASLGLPELAVVHAAGAELLSRRETSVRLAGLMGLDSSRIRAGTAESLDLPRPRRIHLDSSLARIRLGWSPGSL